MDAFGQTVRAGRDLIVHTAATIGPDAADPAMRFSGNGLECQSCHLNAGTTKFGLPLAGVWGVFPLFIGRENEVRTLEERINGCMERSMNGRALPLGQPANEGDAHVYPVHQRRRADRPQRRGAGRAAAPAAGRGERSASTARRCSRRPARCAIRRMGRASAGGRRTRRNGIAINFRRCGDRTATTTARAWRGRSTAASFIHANMPFGTDFAHPVLSAQDAFDVAVFIDSQPRPHREGNEHDFPDRALKPVDATYPPFLGPFPPSQHLTGPWQPIQQWMKDNAHSLRSDFRRHTARRCRWTCSRRWRRSAAG